MKIHTVGETVFAFAMILATRSVAYPQTGSAPSAAARASIDIAAARPGGKEVLIPSRIFEVPAGNDFNDPASDFSLHRSKATDNFVLFWAKEYGDDPMANSVANRRFDAAAALKEADRFHKFNLTGTSADDSIIH